MEPVVIEFIVGLVCSLILLKGVVMPVGKAIVPGMQSLFHALFPLLQKDDLEKQEEALEIAKKRVRIAELQKETVQTEKKAMKIQTSIIDEEFEELDEEEDFRAKK